MTIARPTPIPSDTSPPRDGRVERRLVVIGAAAGPVVVMLQTLLAVVGFVMWAEGVDDVPPFVPVAMVALLILFFGSVALATVGMVLWIRHVELANPLRRRRTVGAVGLATSVVACVLAAAVPALGDVLIVTALVGWVVGVVAVVTTRAPRASKSATAEN